MPRGVYPRTANQLRAAKANLAKGREAPAREKAAATLAGIAQDPAWRKKVSTQTRKAMRRPEVRERHLSAIKGQPTNFRGGNGRPPSERALAYLAALKWLGWTAEFGIRTKGHGTRHNPPRAYKADLANPETMMVLEMDGPAHLPMDRQDLDRKKDEVLQALGWTVIRIPHSKGKEE